MARIVSWFCFDSKLPQDPRLSMLPDNDYRWAWPCLLCLEKQGELEGQDVAGFSHYCHIEHEKFIEILSTMRRVGLLNEDNRPVDFYEWQQCALKSQRNKRSYNKTKTNTDSVGSQSAVSRYSANFSPSDTDTDTDTEAKKNTMSGNTSVVAKEVLGYLNQVTGKRFRNKTNIEACIKREKCSVDDCKIVIDFKWKEWAGTEQQKFVDPTTPFRKANFMRYLDQAMAGEGTAVQAREQIGTKYGVSSANAAAAERVLRRLKDEDRREGQGNLCVDGDCRSVQRANG